MNKKEFQQFLDSIDTANKPRLLLHVCCAPCSSAVLELLSKYFDITIYYYNPNIHPQAEYEKRFGELIKLNKVMNFNYKIVQPKYNPQEFFDIAKGYENLPEGDIRCKKCMEQRMKLCAKYAKENNFDYFTTTLSISPYKNSHWINEIGYTLQDKYNIKFLYSDFKKNNGYLESIKLCKEYNIYRQDYCGCIYSLKERNNASSN